MQRNNQYKNLGGIEAKVQLDVPDRVYVNVFATLVGAGLTVAAIVGGIALLTKKKN